MQLKGKYVKNAVRKHFLRNMLIYGLFSHPYVVSILGFCPYTELKKKKKKKLEKSPRIDWLLSENVMNKI